VHGFAENRENRQPLSRERASGTAVAVFFASAAMRG